MDDIVAYIIDTSSEFDHDQLRLVRKKRFYSLPAQIMELANELRQGRFSGDRLTHSDNPPYDVFKKRLPNPDANVGQSNGYRIVYMAEYSRRLVVLLAIYYKKERESITESYIQDLINDVLESYND
jgi:mRNA-degrading endonuclease RelE of RelBE toxin-antitoxin system